MFTDLCFLSNRYVYNAEHEMKWMSWKPTSVEISPEPHPMYAAKLCFTPAV